MDFSDSKTAPTISLLLGCRFRGNPRCRGRVPPAYITGSVDQELLLRNEYLAAENRVLRAQIKGRLLLSDTEKATVVGDRPAARTESLFEELAAVAKPDTLLAWYRKLIANKFDGSRFRRRVGRPLCELVRKQHG